ncbi:MAG: hypothetical protein AB7Q42_07160 [Acidimicrobiia bacterium]
MANGSGGAPRWWKRILRDPQRSRLDEELRISTLRLEHHRARIRADDAAAQLVADQIAEALHAGENELERRDIDTGYAHLHLAQELEFALLGEIELQARIIELRDEAKADKYGRRRSQTIVGILGIVDGIKPDAASYESDRRAIAREAARIAMTASSNGYRKLTILRRHQTILLLIASVVLVAAAIITTVNAGSFDEIDHGWVAAVAVLLGALGGMASALQRSTRQPDNTIPQQLTSYVVSLSRPLLGATAGLVAYLGQRVVLETDGATRVGAVLVASFAAGFAERLLPVNKEQTSAKPAPDAATP